MLASLSSFQNSQTCNRYSERKPRLLMSAASFPQVWDLDSILPHPSTGEFKQTLDAFGKSVAALSARSAELPAVNGDASNVAAWAGFFDDYAAVATRSSDLNAFIGCHAAADAANKTHQQMEARLSALSPQLEAVGVNLEFALAEASEADFNALLSGDTRLTQIEFYLRELRADAKLRLPKEQQLLASELAVDGIHAWGRLYDRISGDLRVEVMEKGELVRKSVGQVQLDSPQRAVRENNFFALAKAWTSIADTCADALNHIAGVRLTVYDRVGLEDHLVTPLRMNRLQRGTLDAMWSAIDARKGVLVQYLQRKAEAFGLKKPAWFDIQAPYPVATGGSAELPYDDACQQVISTFTRFSGELGDFAGRALRDGWVEVEDRGGKRQGGFCTGIPSRKESRIFMTYTNSADSMSTLAHELGHAYHSYVLRDQPYFLQDYPMNLAETASTFAEAVLGEQRLATAESDDAKIEILDVMLADSVAFLMNIHARYLFENEFYRERAAGELTACRLSEMMVEAQKTAYCNALSDDGWNPEFWISKLHFYISGWPFYNFPYTFGYLLSLGVYALGAESGGDFPAQYRKLLIATGCESAEDAVQKSLGYDLQGEDFWNKSLDIVEQRAAEFLRLTS